MAKLFIYLFIERISSHNDYIMFSLYFSYLNKIIEDEKLNIQNSLTFKNNLIPLQFLLILIQLDNNNHTTQSTMKTINIIISFHNIIKYF